MNFDAALDVIDGLDGEGLDLGEREPVAPDFPLAGVPAPLPAPGAPSWTRAGSTR